jgi:tetraacyldisaccharide 4'-kinase
VKRLPDARGWPAWWLRRGALAMVLAPLALLFGAGAALRRLAYRRGWRAAWRAPVPLLVVGNVTVGGSGKTPLVLAVARALRAHGWHPGIVSRGYGRDPRAPDPLRVDIGSDPAACGDEPLLLRRLAACPVWVGRDRAAAARALLGSDPEVDLLLSDDGLQHLGLARDLELVVVDSRGAGNGWLLPAGPLREPWQRRRDATLGPPAALARVDAAAPRFTLQRRLGALRQFQSGLRLDAAAFARQHAGARVAALAAIGDPQQFFAMLGAAGIALTSTLALPDHAAPDASACAGLKADALILTEKDALKCEPAWAASADVWVAELELDIDPAFIPWLLAQLPALPEHRHGLPPA